MAKSIEAILDAIEHADCGNISSRDRRKLTDEIYRVDLLLERLLAADEKLQKHLKRRSR